MTTVFVTKYALTKGILQFTDGQAVYEGRYFSIRWPHSSRRELVPKKDAYDNIEAAQLRVKEMVRRRLSTLDKELGKLRVIEEHGANIEEVK